MTKPASELIALADLRSANTTRQAEWDPDNQLTLTYRGNELAGEVGEACNVIKKLEREQMGIPGSRDTIAHLAEELADVVICADLIASSVGVDLDHAVRDKFNATSEKHGFKTRLAAGVDALRDLQTWCSIEGYKLGAVDGYDYRSGEEAAYRHVAIEIGKRLATPPAQPAPASGEKSVTCERCQGNGEIVTDWDSYLHPANLAAEQASVAECPDCDGEGTHGKPDGAVREASTVEIENFRKYGEMLKAGTISPLELASTEGGIIIGKLIAEVERLKPYHDELLKIANDVGEPNDPFAAWERVAALHSPKIAAAETSPGDVLAMKEALKPFAELVPSAFDHSYPDDAEIVLSCNGEPHAFLKNSDFRRAKAAFAVKAEAKSQEPEAVAWDTPPIDLPKGLHPKTANLVRRFANALAKKLRLAEERYGYGEEWAKPHWEDDCREHLYQHLEKGDPRDVAAYCAFMWHHGWITTHPTTKPEAPVEQREAIAAQAWPPLKMAVWKVVTDENLNDGHYIKAFDLTAKIYDAILAVRLDEAAIRKDEREKCLLDLQRSYPEHAWLNAARVAIRNGGKQP